MNQGQTQEEGQLTRCEGQSFQFVLWGWTVWSVGSTRIWSLRPVLSPIIESPIGYGVMLVLLLLSALTILWRITTVHSGQPNVNV
jgi:hypothetical protein